MIPRRRRRRAIFLALLVFFFILLLFDTPREQSVSDEEKKMQLRLADDTKKEVPNIFHDQDLDSLKRILENHDSRMRFPTEITGEFRGEWESGDDEFESNMKSSSTKEDDDADDDNTIELDSDFDLDSDNDKNNKVRIIAGLSSSTLEKGSTSSCSLKSKSTTAFSLYIHSSPTNVSDISWLRARVRFNIEDEEEEKDVYMIGVYIRPFGEIALFPSVANITVVTTSFITSLTRRVLLPADLIRYSERKTGNIRFEALTLLSQDSSSHRENNEEKEESEDETMRLKSTCLFQLHLSLDSVSSRFNKHENAKNIDDTNDLSDQSISVRSSNNNNQVNDRSSSHYVECSGELYDFNSNATISVKRLTSYLYDPLRFGMKSKTYALLATACALAQIAALMRQMRSSGTYAAAASVSSLTIGMQGILDGYLCIVHLIVGIVYEGSFKIWASVAFLQFFVFSIFEMRFMLTVWKAMRTLGYNSNNDHNSSRQELSYLYSRFYSAFLIGLVLFYEYWFISDFLVILLHSFWVPQILYNYQQNSAKSLDVSYVVIVTITRLFIPLYVWVCPHNVARYVSAGWIGTPNKTLGLFFVMYMLVQMTILLMQRRFGASFFVPKFMRPPRYDYYRRVPDDHVVFCDMKNDNDAATQYHNNIIVVDCDDDSYDDDVLTSATTNTTTTKTTTTTTTNTSRRGMYCTICMSDIDVTARGSFVVTPCDHFFHSSCLQQWMRIKLACPTCRQSLPPL